MAEITNYTSITSGWMWTGVRNLNQIWTVFRVTSPILVKSISIYWGGYDAPTTGRHFIAKCAPNRAFDLDGIVVSSSDIKVSQGRAWRTATVKETLLEPGVYAIGLFGDYLERRTNALWSGSGGATYVKTTSSMDGRAVGTAWDGVNRTGVLPVRLNYEVSSRIRVKVNNAWQTGTPHVKVNNSWVKSKAVWVKTNGVWGRSK